MFEKLGLRSTDLWLNTNKHNKFPAKKSFFKSFVDCTNIKHCSFLKTTSSYLHLMVITECCHKWRIGNCKMFKNNLRITVNFYFEPLSTTYFKRHNCCKILTAFLLSFRSKVVMFDRKGIDFTFYVCKFLLPTLNFCLILIPVSWDNW